MEYQIGRYDEQRPGMYETELFSGERDIHMGIDIGAPVGTAVHAFADGEIHSFSNEHDAGGYGPVIITSHEISFPDDAQHQWAGENKLVYALHGHLSTSDLEGLSPGQAITAGQVIGHMGHEAENGGWPSHLHFQLSWQEPEFGNMPGVVNQENRIEAISIYPDPRIILGNLY